MVLNVKQGSNQTCNDHKPVTLNLKGRFKAYSIADCVFR